MGHEFGSEARGSATGRRRGGRASSAGLVEVSLEHARYRHLTWALFCFALGITLLLRLGVVGQWVGAILCLLGLLATRSFARTLIRPAGAVRIDDGEITIPRGPCRTDPATFSVTSLRHVFLLRRAVPWTQTGPLLVVETDTQTFTLPLDWFATDADQRRISRALRDRVREPDRNLYD